MMDEVSWALSQRMLCRSPSPSPSWADLCLSLLMREAASEAGSLSSSPSR